MSPLAPSADFLRATPVLGQAATPDQMRKVAEEFEAGFLAMMMRPMFEGLSTDGPFGGGEGESMWRSFMIDEMGKQTARAGGIGLADQVLSEMLKMQEEAQAPLPAEPGDVVPTEPEAATAIPLKPEAPRLAIAA
ncbi:MULTISPECIES: rod-binding protein [Brevundimonas]|uniref:rod-binding protein n=1 Tax=Brevundimonas TaxID=41275 RepID=UPI000F024352|nr:rod-binding protein [Brevundimonas lutea]